MKIIIPFNQWSRTKLMLKRKTATTRTKRYGDIGDTFNEMGITYEIEYIIRCKLSFVTEYYYEKEGCGSRDEFKEIWRAIHRNKGYIPDWPVWLHCFKEI